MSSVDSQLPSGFEELEPFVKLWGIEGAAQRAQRRLESSDAERVKFFTVGTKHLSNALDYLDTKPMAQLDDKERRLMNLMLSLCHVAQAVETQGPDEAKHAQGRRHMKITRASADLQS